MPTLPCTYLSNTKELRGSRFPVAVGQLHGALSERSDSSPLTWRDDQVALSVSRAGRPSRTVRLPGMSRRGAKFVGVRGDQVPVRNDALSQPVCGKSRRPDNQVMVRRRNDQHVIAFEFQHLAPPEIPHVSRDQDVGLPGDRRQQDMPVVRPGSRRRSPSSRRRPCVSPCFSRFLPFHARWQTEQTPSQRRKASKWEAVHPWRCHRAAMPFPKRPDCRSRNAFAERFPHCSIMGTEMISCVAPPGNLPVAA